MIKLVITKVFTLFNKGTNLRMTSSDIKKDEFKGVNASQNGLRIKIDSANVR